MGNARAAFEHTPVSRRGVRRLAGSMWRQASRSLVCPPTPRLDGKRFVVTGGGQGIGLGISRGLLERGAVVEIASRNSAKGTESCRRLREELGASAQVSFAAVDLSDLDAVRDFARSRATSGDRLDGLVCNAGLWPRRHGVSAQGHELAFATNVLGHFLLLEHWVGHVLGDGACVVVVTGDIYILSDDCTSDYAYRTPLGGMLAYCRSKLGNLWIASELARRHPELRVRVAHPGVVATSLGGARSGLADRVSRRLMLDADAGAQTSLFCATQDLPQAAYLHNTLGLMELSDDDPARDAERAAQLWHHCELLCEEWLPVSE